MIYLPLITKLPFRLSQEEMVKLIIYLSQIISL